MIDFRSDTVTQPTPEMRQAMARAEVGDDVYLDDPTVTLLQAKVAQLLGKEASLFMPTGVMSNLVAVMAWTQPGEEVFLHVRSHMFLNESGSLSLWGALVRCLYHESHKVTPA
jgi:threonine aldolase